MGDALTDQVVLVTGSGRGIGAEIAVKAATEGARVAVHYLRSESGARETVARARETGGEGDGRRAPDPTLDEIRKDDPDPRVVGACSEREGRR
jgi:NAD(P)-dependent dehydrogenase (short-subunit alcohol dehydrogenase family)